jgi:hypothetical protein
LGTVQIFEIIAVVAIAVAIVAGVGLGLVYRRLQRYQHNQHVIMGSRGSVDIIEHVSAMDDKLANVRLALEDLTLATRDHDVRIDTCLSRVGIVRFDAYQDLGGRQSSVVALLNSHGDGVVVTTVVSRDFARMYVKLLKEGASDIPLAPEELEAIEQAQGSAPFTIRPRVDGALEEPSHDEEDALSPQPDELVSMGLPGRRGDSERELARENRRRTREGLPPIEGEVVPSAVGWQEPRTLGADDDADHTMAQQYLKKRRSIGRRGKNKDDLRGDRIEAMADEEARGADDEL